MKPLGSSAVASMPAVGGKNCAGSGSTDKNKASASRGIPAFLHVHAAVDGEHVAGNVTGLLADQELHGVGDVLGLADAAERNPGEDLGLHLLGQVERPVQAYSV